MGQFYRAYNSALSTTTGIAAGTSYTTGAKCALQLAIPVNGFIELSGFGISFDESATTNTAAKNALIEIAYTATATTGLTAHAAATVQPINQGLVALASRLTMGTASTGYGAVAITSNTTLDMPYRAYIPQTGGIDYIFPEGRLPLLGNAAARFVQFRINTTATVNAVIYLDWDESIT